MLHLDGSGGLWEVEMAWDPGMQPIVKAGRKLHAQGIGCNSM